MSSMNASTESLDSETSTALDGGLYFNNSMSDDAFLPWNNPFNVISLETLIFVENATSCGLNHVLCLIGIPTNILNCIIFYRQGLRDRMNLCLFCLAIADASSIATIYIYSSFCLVRWTVPEDELWWKVFVRWHFTGFYMGCVSISGCLTLIIALERCLCVLMPLKAASLISTRGIGSIILGVAVLLQTVGLLYPLQYKMVYRVDPVSGQSKPELDATDFFLQNRQLYHVVQNTFLMVGVPVVTFTGVSVATMITVIQLKRSIAWREETSSIHNNRREVVLIKMLIVVSCIYIVTSAPSVALGVTRLVVKDFLYNRRYSNIFIASHLIFMTITMFNSSVNFFVYLARSSRYRKELRRLLYICIKKKPHDLANTTGKESATGAISVSVSEKETPCEQP